MKKNEIDKIFAFFPIDDAIEICILNTMNEIERKLEYEQQKFIDNVIVRYVNRRNNYERLLHEFNRNMKHPIFKSAVILRDAIMKLNSNNVNPN